MQLSSLLFAAKANISIGEALLDLVLGTVIIFIVLAVLIGIIYLMKLVFELAGRKKKKEMPAITETEKSNSVAVCDDEEVAAVIGAVLSLYYDECAVATKKAPFIVKNIYKIK